MAYAGMDAMACPPMEQMKQLFEETNLVWTGFYLSPTSTYVYPGWAGASIYSDLKKIGWAVVPIYMGHQGIMRGRDAPVAGKQGKADGKLAASLARRSGFTSDSVIYLDVEFGPGPYFQGDQPALAYFREWVRAVFDSGYRPGVYCNPSVATEFAMAVPQVPIWAVRPSKGKEATFKENAPEPSPSQSGYGPAVCWQYAWNSWIEVEGHKLPKGSWIDLNSSTLADPSRWFLRPKIDFS